MKIIRRKADSVVIFSGQEFELTNDGLKGKDFRAPNVTSANHEILIVQSVPEDWQGGWYTYDGLWEKTDLWKSSEVVPTINERFTLLKTDFITYMDSHYDLGTQGTIRDAYANPMSDQDMKNNAVDVLVWANSVRRYYIDKKRSVRGGDMKTTWDFKQFDKTKPIWDFEDFV